MLGGSASSRLFQEIRERRGMAYSVYTFGSQYADTGMVGVYVGTREDNLAECMRITADQLVRMGQGEFADDELQRSKENLKGRIMLSMESTSNRASRLGKSVLTDTELLSLDRICAEIDSVEPEAVASLARQLFAPDRLSGANSWRASDATASGSTESISAQMRSSDSSSVSGQHRTCPAGWRRFEVDSIDSMIRPFRFSLERCSSSSANSPCPIRASWSAVMRMHSARLSSRVPT